MQILDRIQSLLALDHRARRCFGYPFWLGFFGFVDAPPWRRYYKILCPRRTDKENSRSLSESPSWLQTSCFYWFHGGRLLPAVAQKQQQQQNRSSCLLDLNAKVPRQRESSYCFCGLVLSLILDLTWGYSVSFSSFTQLDNCKWIADARSSWRQFFSRTLFGFSFWSSRDGDLFSCWLDGWGYVHSIGVTMDLGKYLHKLTIISICIYVVESYVVGSGLVQSDWIGCARLLSIFNNPNEIERLPCSHNCFLSCWPCCCVVSF